MTDYDDHEQDEAETRAQVRMLNERLGTPRAVEDAMLYGSVFGWHVPAAARAFKLFEQLGTSQ
jgi:hypothetical protein